jgi:hypothetical protein
MSFGRPYDIIVLGEEHGNKEYNQVIVEALPALLKIGYGTFAMEKPSDLQEESLAYIDGRVRLNEITSEEALWRIISKLSGEGVPFGRRRGGGPDGVDNLRMALDVLTEASIAGMEVKAVDVPVRLRSRDGGDDWSRRSVGLRNQYMAGLVEPGTVLLVGRGHTGEGRWCVDAILRRRGFSVLSIDLVGADRNYHSEPLDGADLALTPREIRVSGGLARVALLARRSGSKE